MSADLNGSACFFYFHLSKLGGKLVFLGNLMSRKDATCTKLNVKDNFLQELIDMWALRLLTTDLLTPNMW